MSVVAFHNCEIIGVVDTAQYEGAEAAHPHGFSHLLAAGIGFDVVDVDFPTEAMATAMVDKYAPPNPHLYSRHTAGEACEQLRLFLDEQDVNELARIASLTLTDGPVVVYNRDEDSAVFYRGRQITEGHR